MDAFVLRTCLMEAAMKLGVSLSSQQADKLLGLLDELDHWNQRMNLTAIRERPQQITKHLLDSLSVQPFLHGTRIADIGTGAGFPGLPLALVNPGRQFTLIDSTAKKLQFVEHAARLLGLHAARLLGLENVEITHTRAEAYLPPQGFDRVLSRAMGSLADFVKWCGHLCGDDGRLLAMKGRYPRQELKELPGGWKVSIVRRLEVPNLDEERHLVEIYRSRERI